jgi:nicotinamidase-related amidase
MSSKTALILIDPYNDFLHPEGKLYPALSDSLSKTNAIAHLKAVVKSARAKGIPVFYCMHQQTDDHSYKDWTLMNASLTRIRDRKAFRAGTFGTEYFEGLEPNIEKGDVVVGRHWNSRYVDLE